MIHVMVKQYQRKSSLERQFGYAEDIKKTSFDNKDSYITSGVDGSTDSTTAQNAASSIMNYRAKFNTDNTGKITICRLDGLLQ